MELIVKFSLVETGVLSARVYETSQSQSRAGLASQVTVLGLTGNVGSSPERIAF